MTKIPLVPGVNGCRKGATGHLPVLTRLRGEGWIPIDEAGAVKLSDPDGTIIDDDTYLLRWEGRRGPIYQDCWSHPTLIGHGPTARVDWSSQYDRPGFRAWRAWLVDSGTLPDVTAGVAARLCKVQGSRAARRTAEGHDGNPHVQAHVNHELSKLDGMKDAAAAKGARVKGRTSKPKKRGPGRPRKVRADAD